MTDADEEPGRLDDMRHLLGFVLLHRDPVPLIVSASVITIVLGASIAPSDVFDRNPSYSLFTPFCEEWVLGSLLVILGIAKLLALVYSRHRALRWLMLASTMTWGALAAGVAASWALSAAPPLYAAIGLMSLWAYLLLGVDGRD